MTSLTVNSLRPERRPRVRGFDRPSGGRRRHAGRRRKPATRRRLRRRQSRRACRARPGRRTWPESSPHIRRSNGARPPAPGWPSARDRFRQRLPCSLSRSIARSRIRRSDVVAKVSDAGDAAHAAQRPAVGLNEGAAESPARSVPPGGRRRADKTRLRALSMSAACRRPPDRPARWLPGMERPAPWG